MSESRHPELDALIEVMATLRGTDGCAWDREQTHESLLKYLTEESHEFIDAVESGDRADMREELGDVLYQVLFHADVSNQGLGRAGSHLRFQRGRAGRHHHQAPSHLTCPSVCGHSARGRSVATQPSQLLQLGFEVWQARLAGSISWEVTGQSVPKAPAVQQ